MAARMLILTLVLHALISSSWALVAEKNVMFYMHDIVKRANPTAVVVAGVNGTSSELLRFGTVLVMDDLLTEGPSRFSSLVGRAKGFYAGSDVKGYAIHMMFSLVFENKEYNGSTLEFHGTDIWTKPSGREISVVGGTGKFRYARGYSIVTDNPDPDEYKGYLKFNTTFRVD